MYHRIAQTTVPLVLLLYRRSDSLATRTTVAAVAAAETLAHCNQQPAKQGGRVDRNVLPSAFVPFCMIRR